MSIPVRDPDAFTVSIEHMARALLRRDPLLLRALVLEWTRWELPASWFTPPTTDDPAHWSVAAALAELLAERTGTAPPE